MHQLMFENSYSICHVSKGLDKYLTRQISVHHQQVKNQTSQGLNSWDHQTSSITGVLGIHQSDVMDKPTAQLSTLGMQNPWMTADIC